MSSHWDLSSRSVGFLDDRYEVGELLGAGAMGTVFAAKDLILGIDVAVKVMHEKLARSKKDVARFAAEASLCSRMWSPHVVRTLAIAVTRDGVPCIVYERLVGETLGTRLEREGGLPLGLMLEIVKQTARALARAHAIGVIHRDVKPDNIFLTEDARGQLLVKLLDFGIAEASQKDGTYSATLFAGTPEYMAPEVLFGTHETDARSDLYALGVIAFECLTGRCPFMGDLVAVVEQHGAATRPSLTEHRPDLDGLIDAWMTRALDPEPAHRFASAKELAESLELAVRSTKSNRSVRTKLLEAA